MKNNIELKGYCYADGTHWYWEEKEIAIINESNSEIEWCVRKSSLPAAVVQAVYDKKPKIAGKWIIETRRVRQSATQGEIHVQINGATIAVFSDDIVLNNNGNYESAIPDKELGKFVIAAFWNAYDSIYRLSDRAKDVFDPDWRKTTDTPAKAKQTICVETPVGNLYAYPSSDPDYPGIYIDLHRDGCDVDAPLLLIDFSKTEFPECRNEEYKDGALVCRCWRDVTKEDYDEKDRVIFEKYEDFFRDK